MKSPSPGWAYRLLALPLWLFWQAHALHHGRRHGVANYRAMRTAAGATDTEPRIWIHAASVGEVHAVSPLVRALLNRGEKILLTSFTATGYRTICETFAESLRASVIPIDSYCHCRRFLHQHNIRLALIMETELWPELLVQTRKQGIELILLNARLSNKSLDSGAFGRQLLARTLALFSQILVRSDADREAFRSLGAAEERISIIGNLKTRSPPASAPTRLVERDYLLLASSHESEEQALLASRPLALRNFLLVIAPRHPDRSAAIQAQIEALGLNYSVRSRQQTVTPDTEIYLADTFGELPAFMAHAKVVVMGGSFDETGGHNLIEPASLGCAIITGPADSNIHRDIEMLGVGEGLLQVPDIEACWQSIEQLLADPTRAQALAETAKSRLADQPDILQAYLNAIESYL
jgi:3-deoxy-D-manno-octulosonic-acid transferase